MGAVRTTVVCLAFILLGNAIQIGESPQRQNISSAARRIIPTAANNPGQFGSFFKTRVAIVNVTSRSYIIFATLYRSGGGTIVRQIAMASRQAQNYDNFLQDVFSYSGAAGVDLDAVSQPGGSDLNEFAVFAEVYNDSPNGRYKTVVDLPESSDSLSLTEPSITPGITVDGTTRTNIGCVNTATTQSIINVDQYSSTGSLLTTYFLTIPATGWAQAGALQSVSGGYLVWRLQSGVSPAPDCYAVVVDNQSNDGSFIQPTKFTN